MQKVAPGPFRVSMLELLDQPDIEFVAGSRCHGIARGKILKIEIRSMTRPFAPCPRGTPVASPDPRGQTLSLSVESLRGRYVEHSGPRHEVLQTRLRHSCRHARLLLTRNAVHWVDDNVLPMLFPRKPLRSKGNLKLTFGKLRTLQPFSENANPRSSRRKGTNWKRPKSQARFCAIAALDGAQFRGEVQHCSQMRSGSIFWSPRLTLFHQGS